MAATGGLLFGFDTRDSLWRPLISKSGLQPHPGASGIGCEYSPQLPVQKPTELDKHSGCPPTPAPLAEVH